MQAVDIRISGIEIDFELAGNLAEDLVRRDIESPMLLCWSDSVKGLHSPSGVQCEIKGDPGWEVYGRSHGGQYRISVNNDEYVFIFC